MLSDGNYLSVVYAESASSLSAPFDSLIFTFEHYPISDSKINFKVKKHYLAIQVGFKNSVFTFLTRAVSLSDGLILEAGWPPLYLSSGFTFYNEV